MSINTYEVAVPMILTSQGPVKEGKEISKQCSDYEIKAMLKRGDITAVALAKMPPPAALVIPAKPTAAQITKGTEKAVTAPTPVVEKPAIPDNCPPSIDGIAYICDICGKSGFASAAGLASHHRHCRAKQGKKA